MQRTINLLIGVVKMQNRNELIKLSQYFNIVCTCIEKYNICSLFKIGVTCLILHYQSSNIELRKNDRNLLNGFFEHLHSILFSNYYDFNYIFKSVNILEKNGFIEVFDDKIIKKTNLDYVQDKYLNKDNISEILSCISSLSLISFIQEVLSNV